jgi:hypothetical protein
MNNANSAMTRENKAYYYMNDVIIPQPPSNKPSKKNHFILRLEDGTLVRIVYYYHTHPVKPGWYVIDIAITGLTCKVQCYEVELYGGEPYYDEKLENTVKRRNYIISVLNDSSVEYIDVVRFSLDEIIPKVLK